METPQRAEGKRRARVAAPGARRVIFTGVMAVPDDFGRIRVILTDRAADGTPDDSWTVLARELPRAGDARSVPYELREGGADADGVRGVAWVVVPQRYRAHWGRVAEGLRGQEVRVEATVRPFTLFTSWAGPKDGEAPPAGSQTVLTGAALDLAMLGPRVVARESAL